MEPCIEWSKEAATRFPGVLVCTGGVSDVKVERHYIEAERMGKAIVARLRQNFRTELLKNDTTVRAYRDLFWALGIDPTETRPSGEALLRRTLHGSDVPSISNVVDAYNLASMETIIPLSGFDLDLICLPLEIRFSHDNDEFRGIGMDKSVKFAGRALLVTDRKQVLCIYPYRDADATKITGKTHNALIIGYGAPGIGGAILVGAVEKALAYIVKVAGGQREKVNVFQSNY
jgi:DNA/RNA-binding domain of Phe-tRNA-synthetase-like protein